MLPFLLLSHRPEDDAAAAEYQSFRTLMGLGPADLVQVRMNLEPRPAVDFSEYSGIILGGGPFNNTDVNKSDIQIAVENYLNPIVLQAIERDFPFFGACYGIGVIGSLIGATVNRVYGEKPACINATVTDAGAADPVLAGMPKEFDTLVGHVEAIETLPGHATHLISGADCPVQMFKVGSNVYATQFHPELELETFIQRLKIYANNGYYEPHEYDEIVAGAAAANLETDNLILRNFAEVYAR
ncbi:MAG: glutamine amidotransferase [Corynebacterium sp.]|nr:glutamine amidotransferase [Corynebacterium sp.]